MYVTLVHVHVKPEHLEEFIDSIRANHEASVREAGNVRFDVLQSVDDPTRFILHEWYVDEDAAKAHDELAARQALEARPAGEREQLLVERARESCDRAAHRRLRNTPTTLPRIRTWSA